MTSVTVNGQDLGLQGRTAILDTGTTLILIASGKPRSYTTIGDLTQDATLFLFIFDLFSRCFPIISSGHWS